jgi:ABC-type xylose transport system permease subunit
VAYAGLLAIIAAVIIGLAAAGLAWWLSALLVGVVVAGIGGFLVMRGLTALKNEDLTPRETMQSLEDLKEDLSGTNRIRNRATG